MASPNPMLTVVTGAAGFIGRALTRLMAESDYPGAVRLVDRMRPETHGRFDAVVGDIGDKAALLDLVRDADRIIHLAVLPGGAAEGDPQGSRRINLDASLDLIETAAGMARPTRLVLASSVAVLGAPLPAEVNDETAARPSMTYGAHKLMAEIALADAVRRRDVSGLALRLPGIVARPRGAVAFKSGFMSDIFWAIRAGEDHVLPVSPDATMWIMSARCCARNLLHAAGLDLPPDAPAALTLPALRTSMSELVEAIARATGRDSSRIAYRPDPDLEAQFGRQPPLRTPAADRFGFRHDGDLDRLVGQVFEGLPTELAA